MRTLMIALLLTFSAVGAQAQPAGQEADIQRFCAARWRVDYEMQEYCIRQQQEARAWVQNRRIDSGIAAHCRGRWPSDWEMFAYCVKQQEEAYTAVRSASIEMEIAGYCKGRWPSDWEM